MENSDDRAVRFVRCPKCHGILKKPGAPIYRCGGCRTTLRAKFRTGSAEEGAVITSSPSRKGRDLASREVSENREARIGQSPSNDHEEPAPKSVQGAAAQSARDGEDTAAASAAAAGGKAPELQAENLPADKEPKEAKQRLPPCNRCRPVLNGAPFIICSSCFKLVQVPADFAFSTDAVRKLQCGSCSSVLSYSYRDPARKKPCHDLIDQLSSQYIHSRAAGGCSTTLVGGS